MSAAEKANLARIRDNQRRSRARRKEYLQELEARLRQCELQGIEASAEIQLAARRVADENKKLRLLLAQHGVADESVDAFLQSTAGSEALMGTPGLNGMGSMGNGTVQVLDSLLNTRKQCSADGNTAGPESISTTAGLRSRDSSAGSISTVQWDPTYPNHMRPQSDHLHLSGAGKPPPHQFMTPPSSASRTVSAASTGRGSMSVQQQVQHQQQQQQQSQSYSQVQPPQHQQQQQQQQRIRINSITSSISSSASPANTTTAQQTQPIYDFDTQIALSPTFHSHQRHPSQHNMPAPGEPAQSHTQSQQIASNSHSTQYIPTTSNIRGTNCLYATDMITTMAGGESQAVRAELCGMPKYDPDMECEVDNQLVFNVMDRYSGQSIGL